MKLETAESISSASATEAELHQAFADDSGRGEFIILSESDQVYIQAAGEGDGPYTLEYRAGDKEHHFECVGELDKAQVEMTFLKYLKRDGTWKTSFQWKKQEQKPWWRFW